MKKNLRERDIEKYLVEKVADLEGKAFKWSSPGNRAVPDRICIIPNGGIVFVECKAPNKKPTPLQQKVIDYIRKLGQTVAIIDSKEKVDALYEIAKHERKQINEQ